eukprot:TRINITY_DN808_c0_g2_i1.p1 TRINITY_DN808_c0_g2~~TRINITY_DN808_c0_g2_i1.p1  ORF type:complete len:696 (+),score=206.73 TRINITY_DN808_c0_g2_i1:111-2198(+)
MEGGEEKNPWDLRKEEIETELAKSGVHELPSHAQPKSEFVDLYYKHILQASPHPKRALTRREENPDRMRQAELAKVLKEHSIPTPRGKNLAELRLRYKRYVLGEGFEESDEESEEESEEEEKVVSPGSKRGRSASDAPDVLDKRERKSRRVRKGDSDVEVDDAVSEEEGFEVARDDEYSSEFDESAPSESEFQEDPNSMFSSPLMEYHPEEFDASMEVSIGEERPMIVGHTDQFSPPASSLSLRETTPTSSGKKERGSKKKTKRALGHLSPPSQSQSQSVSSSSPSGGIDGVISRRKTTMAAEFHSPPMSLYTQQSVLAQPSPFPPTGMSSAGLMRKERIPKMKMHEKTLNESDFVKFLKKIGFFFVCAVVIFVAITYISEYLENPRFCEPGETSSLTNACEQCPEHSVQCDGRGLLECENEFFISANKRQCLPCPSNSIGCNGISFECQSPHEKMGDSCVLSSEMARTKERMSGFLINYIHRQAGKKACTPMDDLSVSFVDGKEFLSDKSMVDSEKFDGIWDEIISSWNEDGSHILKDDEKQVFTSTRPNRPVGCQMRRLGSFFSGLALSNWPYVLVFFTVVLCAVAIKVQQMKKEKMTKRIEALGDHLFKIAKRSRDGIDKSDAAASCRSKFGTQTSSFATDFDKALQSLRKLGRIRIEWDDNDHQRIVVPIEESTHATNRNLDDEMDAALTN